MNMLNKLYVQLPKEVRQQCHRIGELTVILSAYEKELLEIYQYSNMKEFAWVIREGCKYQDLGLLLTPTILLQDSEDNRETLDKINQQHPVHSKKIVNFIGEDCLYNEKEKKVINDICLYHHERCDGSGYPSALEFGEIPLVSALCGLARDIDLFLKLVKQNDEAKLFDIDHYITKERAYLYSEQVRQCFLRAKHEVLDYYIEKLV